MTLNKSYRLDQIAKVKSSKRVKRADYVSSGVPFFRSKEVIELAKGNEISTELFISEEHYKSIKDKYGVPTKGDILITSVGTLGVPYLLPDNNEFYFKDGNLTWLSQFDEEKVYPPYIFYWLRSPIGKHRLDSVSIGTTQRALTITALNGLEIELPPITTQKKIAEIVRNLEDKVGNNVAMNRTLEKLAQRIFKSWFIDFDPVKANKEGLPFDGLSPEIQALFPNEFEESELGMIPKGWEVSNIEKYATNVRKNIKKGDIDSDMPYLGLEHINRKCLSVYEHGLGESVTSNKSQFQVNDILLGKLRPYFHKVGIPNFDGVCSTDILVVRPKESFYFEYALNVIYQDRLIDHLTRCSSGTRMPRAKWADVTDYQLATPLDDSIFKAFSKITSPLYQRLLNNCNEVDILSKLRDRLLPKLISGQISVGEAAQELAEAV